MTFDAQHYVPVLKVKRGEKRALRAIAPALRKKITPLLEIVERRADGKAIGKHLDTAFDKLAESVEPYPKCFLDAHEIAKDGPRAAAAVFRRASSAGIVFTPVTGLSRTADMAAALKQPAGGIAVRLTREEFESGGLASRLKDFVTTHNLAPGTIDVIFDLGSVDDMVTAGVIALTAAFMADVPDHPQWRTLTVSACAFPKSMGAVARNSHDTVERVDWLAWRDGLQARQRGLPRLPTFSDYAIQHPSGVEGFDPKIHQVSASIRYAQPHAWLLIKGESTKTNPATEQFPLLAERLAHGPLQPEFAGAGHCSGCESMVRAVGGAPGLGSAEVWRRLGTIHHISTVMQGLAALSWP